MLLRPHVNGAGEVSASMEPDEFRRQSRRQAYYQMPFCIQNL